MLKDVLRKVTAFVDGHNYAGQATQVTLPELNVQTEEIRAGGMDSPMKVDMGMELGDASLQFATVPAEAMKLLGKPDIQLTLRGSLVSFDGSVRGATAVLQGRFIGNNPGDWQAGQPGQFTATFAPHYYKLTIEGDVIYEIDVPGMKRIIGGVDQLADERRVLGQ
jgi:uncharacterized protein